jgi:hypothetical protein
MIFDEDLEMSERKVDNDPMTLMEPNKATLKNKLQPNPYDNSSVQPNMKSGSAGG